MRATPAGILAMVAGLYFCWEASAQLPEFRKLSCDTLEVCLGYVTEPYACKPSDIGCDATGTDLPIQQGYFDLPHVQGHD